MEPPFVPGDAGGCDRLTPVAEARGQLDALRREDVRDLIAYPMGG
ncbi:MAG TPA: hypothetical protein VH092_20025 [Urbifossiella sp.]|nr:hypothetical protein [Urbifossiella sp.]